MVESRYLPNTAISTCGFTTSPGNGKVVFAVKSSISSYSPLVKQFTPSRALKLGDIAACICGCNLDSK